MYEVKKDIVGPYIKKLIADKEISQREFCRRYLNLNGFDCTEEDVRKMANRLSQIIKGKKSIQVFDLPAFTEILGVSCEELISGGTVFSSSSSHVTNYDVALSNDPDVWEKHIQREDKLILNPDEYGKTILDYAFEFKNYVFLKYMMNHDYIWFVDNSGWQDKGYTYGGGTNIKRREIGAVDYSVPMQIQYEDYIRTNMIALAIENEDFVVLDGLCARENPLMHNANYSVGLTREEKYRNENMIDALVNASPKMLEYFSRDFKVKNINKCNNTFIYPYLGEVIDKMIQAKKIESAKVVLEKVAEHNKKVYETIFSMVEQTLEVWASSRSYTPDERAIKEQRGNITGYIFYSEITDMISFVYNQPKEEIMTNLIKVKKNCKELADLINSTNDYYKKTLALKGDS